MAASVKRNARPNNASKMIRTQPFARTGLGEERMLRSIAAALLVVAGSAWATQAADYPDKPVTLVIPFPQGGSTGYTAKVLADELQKIWRQPVNLEVKSGNFGIDAIQTVVGKSNGYTLMVGSIITNSMTPVMHPEKMSFSYDKEIIPVSRLAEFPSVVMVRTDTPADNLKDYLAHLKRTSGKLVYGTDFVGTYVDVDAIQIGKVVGLQVAYHAVNGAAAILNALLEGKVNFALLNVATASANVGKYKALAVTAPRRLANFPDVPTMDELGFSGIASVNWQGLFAARGISPGDIQALHAAVGKAMATPEAKDAFAKVNAGIAVSISPRTFADEIKAEMVRWEKAKPEVLALPQE
jgi:tripartite-type tricarboxylate transporter receptor subunit TctC